LKMKTGALLDKMWALRFIPFLWVHIWATSSSLYTVQVARYCTST